MSCRSTKGRYLANKSRCIITLITEYLTWLVKTKTWGNFKKNNKKNNNRESGRKPQVAAGPCRGWRGALNPAMRGELSLGAGKGAKKGKGRERKGGMRQDGLVPGNKKGLGGLRGWSWVRRCRDWCSLLLPWWHFTGAELGLCWWPREAERGPCLLLSARSWPAAFLLLLLLLHLCGGQGCSRASSVPQKALLG